MNNPKPISSIRRSAVCAAPLAGLLGLLGVAPGAQAQIKSGDNPEASEVWKKVRASLFQSRPIEAATDDIISIDRKSVV